MKCKICLKEFKEGDLLLQKNELDFISVFCMECLDQFSFGSLKKEPNAIAVKTEILGTKKIKQEI